MAPAGTSGANANTAALDTAALGDRQERPLPQHTRLPADASRMANVHKWLSEIPAPRSSTSSSSAAHSERRVGGTASAGHARTSEVAGGGDEWWNGGGSSRARSQKDIDLDKTKKKMLEEMAKYI